MDYLKSFIEIIIRHMENEEILQDGKIEYNVNNEEGTKWNSNN